jgi:hypothetical protein
MNLFLIKRFWRAQRGPAAGYGRPEGTVAAFADHCRDAGQHRFVPLRSPIDYRQPAAHDR